MRHAEMMKLIHRAAELPATIVYQRHDGDEPETADHSSDRWNSVLAHVAEAPPQYAAVLTDTEHDLPSLKLLLVWAERDDVRKLTVRNLASLGRNPGHLVSTLTHFLRLGVSIQVNDAGLYIPSHDAPQQGGGVATPFEVMTLLDEARRHYASQRARRGHRSAAEQGNRTGRKPALDEDQIKALMETWEQGDASVREQAARFHVSEDTIRRAIKRERERARTSHVPHENSDPHGKDDNRGSEVPQPRRRLRDGPLYVGGHRRRDNEGEGR